MGKIQLNVRGAFQVVKTFHNDQLYVAGTAIDIKDNKLSSELSAKGLVELRQVEVKKPVVKRGRKK